MRKTIKSISSATLFVAGLMMLSSCVKDSFENTAEQQKQAQYDYGFVEKYGKVAPSQSWDFSGVTTAQTAMRSVSADEVCSKSQNNTELGSKTSEINAFIDKLKKDKDAVKEAIKTTEKIDFAPYKYSSVILFPMFMMQEEPTSAIYFTMDICWGENSVNVYDSKLQNGGYWSDVVLEKKCRNINTTLLTKEEDVYWRAYPVYGGNTPNKDDKAKNADISQRLKDFEIKQFRIINIEDRSYWCFDVEYMGYTSYMVFYAKDLKVYEPTVISKRYMVEDLGSVGDYDFNDIVFDVIDTDGKQECFVRALGGTLEISIKVGDSTWSKAPTYNAKQMINTTAPIDYDAAYAHFDVTGWDYDKDNVSVIVNNGAETPYTIQFPANGTIPRMVAVKTTKHWMEESVSVPKPIATWLAN